jgi:RNA polymerase sigma-B factor
MSGAEFAIWRVRGVDVVRVDGALDLTAAVRLRLILYGRLDAGADRIVVDLSGVPLLDAGAVSVLLKIRQRLADRGGTLTAPGARGMVLEMLRIAGVVELLAAGSTLDPALADRTDAGVEPTAHAAWGDDVHGLFDDLHALPAGAAAAAAAIRETIILRCLPSAHALAARFHRLGEPAEDLDQVAALALVKAVDRYRPQLGTDFAAYAVPTIVGELKRHLRDRGWAVHVPRRMQELRLELNWATDELSHELGRRPTVRDLAERLDLDEAEVLQAQRATRGLRAASLSAPVGTGEGITLADTLGADDDGYAAVDHHESLRPLLAALPDRERQILQLRFVGDLTQSQIAAALGISQIHVSRLLTRTLATLRVGLLGYTPTHP